jgi:predicted DNA-binding protein with PD1-like motif
VNVTDDKAYHDAAHLTIGNALAAMFAGLVGGGMTREEALEVVVAYAASLAQCSKHQL